MKKSDKRIEEDFKEYTNFLKEYFPKFNSNDLELLSLYKYINNAFILCDILLEYDKVKVDDNYYYLLIEYREFNARILTTISLNDSFLIENIMRIIIEKIYRTACGIVKPKRGERRIRSENRSNMSSILQNNFVDDNIISLDKLYNDYSTKIHHTNSSPSDYYDLTRRLEMSQNNLSSIIDDMGKIQKIFLEEIFIKISPNSKDEETSYKMKIRNNTSDDVVTFLNLD